MNINKLRTILNEDGCLKVENIIPVDLVKPIHLFLKKLIIIDCKKHNFYKHLQNFPQERTIFEGLKYLCLKDQESMRKIIDKMNVSNVVSNLVNSNSLKEFSYKILKIQNPEDVVFSHIRFRADFPDNFAKEKKKFSLLWHQESSYFKNLVDSKNSYVLWIPLMNCLASQGVVETLKKSHLKGKIKHQEYYADPKNKRHQKLYIDEKILESFEKFHPNCSIGDVIISHFNTVHRSGKNIDTDYIRFSLIIRVSDLTKDSFLI